MIDDMTPVWTGWRSNGTENAPYAALEGTIETDVAIVGAGFTGLSAAWHLASRYGVNCVVLEAQQPGWGASGRNGGFCCLGGAKASLTTLARRHGDMAARQWLGAQVESVERVRSLSRELGIDVQAQPEGEYALAHSLRAANALREETDSLRRHYGLETHWLPADAMPEAGLGNGLRFGAAFTAKGFGLNPLAYVQGLADACRRAGVRVYGDSTVTGLSPATGGIQVRTAAAAVSARQVILATNAYTPEAVFPGLAGRLLPVLSNVLMTAPISDEAYAAQGWTTPHAAYDTRRLLHYFRRLPDGRFLFGGRGGLTDTPAARVRFFDALEQRFRQRFPAWRDIAVERRWNGWACLARDLHPHIAQLAPGVFCALAYHGNGVAMGTWSGAAIAAVVAGDRAETARIPAFLRTPPPRFPLPWLRRGYLLAAYAGYGVLDRF